MQHWEKAIAGGEKGRSPACHDRKSIMLVAMAS